MSAPSRRTHLEFLEGEWVVGAKLLTRMLRSAPVTLVRSFPYRCCIYSFPGEPESIKNSYRLVLARYRSSLSKAAHLVVALHNVLLYG